MLIPLTHQSSLDLLRVDPITVLSRSDWGAKPVLEGALRHRIHSITIHHAGVATNRARTTIDKLRGLQAWSQRADKLASGKEKPAWPDIPYHYYIFWDGTITECRPSEWVGDTNTEYNPTGHLLVCLEGNFESEEPTGAQIRSLYRFTEHFAVTFRVPPERIQSHKDYSAQTTCPGQNLAVEIEKIRARWALRLKLAGVPQWK